MKKLFILFLSLWFPSMLSAATYPNYFVTNAAPFSVVSGASMYVPTMYSTNMLTTNLTVTDYLFIGTAQINYLNALGTVTASNVVTDAVRSRLVNADYITVTNNITAVNVVADATGLFYGNGLNISNVVAASGSGTFNGTHNGTGSGLTNVLNGKAIQTSTNTYAASEWYFENAKAAAVTSRLGTFGIVGENYTNSSILMFGFTNEAFNLQFQWDPDLGRYFTAITNIYLYFSTDHWVLTNGAAPGEGWTNTGADIVSTFTCSTENTDEAPYCGQQIFTPVAVFANNRNGYVGIGTNAPEVQLHIVGLDGRELKMKGGEITITSPGENEIFLNNRNGVASGSFDLLYADTLADNTGDDSITDIDLSSHILTDSGGAKPSWTVQGSLTATNFIGQHQLSLGSYEFYTNRVLTASGEDTFRTCGTNQLITMPDCTTTPVGYNIRIMSDNGNGSIIITNATGDQSIRESGSLSFKMIGVDTIGLVNSGTNWYALTRAKIIWPNAQFSCTTNVPLTAANTAYPIGFNSVDFNNSQGIALGDGTNAAYGNTKMWITNSGQYELSPSIVQTFNGNDNIRFWFRNDNTNVPNSMTVSKGQNGSVRVITVPFIVSVTGPTAYEIWAESDSTGESLLAEAASGNYPACPSVICPIKRISDLRP